MKEDTKAEIERQEARLKILRGQHLEIEFEIKVRENRIAYLRAEYPVCSKEYIE